MKDIQEMFENARQNGLFADYDFFFAGRGREQSFSGGSHVKGGADLFDVASLTKSLTSLLFLKLFSQGEISPETRLGDMIKVPNADDRRLWHMLCYLGQGYAFDREALRAGKITPFRDVLLNHGFGHWGRRFMYDNFASAYLGLVLQEMYKEPHLMKIFWEQFQIAPHKRGGFIFHPQQLFQGSEMWKRCIPTSLDASEHGYVHDPLSRSHQSEEISVAGLFSNAETIGRIFQKGFDEILSRCHYDQFAENQLTKIGITDHTFALGFDIPYADSLRGIPVEGPLVFAGHTGCRIFVSKHPRITLCILTNRVIKSDTVTHRVQFREFFWSVLREVLRHGS